jgi:hypothetical protein
MRSIPGQVIWDLWWTEWTWRVFFFQVLLFILPILIPPTAPYSSVIRGWYNRPNSVVSVSTPILRIKKEVSQHRMAQRQGLLNGFHKKKSLTGICYWSKYIMRRQRNEQRTWNSEGGNLFLSNPNNERVFTPWQQTQTPIELRNMDWNCFTLIYFSGFLVLSCKKKEAGNGWFGTDGCCKMWSSVGTLFNSSMIHRVYLGRLESVTDLTSRVSLSYFIGHSPRPQQLTLQPQKLELLVMQCVKIDLVYNEHINFRST